MKKGILLLVMMTLFIFFFRALSRDKALRQRERELRKQMNQRADGKWELNTANSVDIEELCREG